MPAHRRSRSRRVHARGRWQGLPFGRGYAAAFTAVVFHAIAYAAVDNAFIFIAKPHTWAYKYRPPPAEAEASQP